LLKREQELEADAFTDPLTGLLNRRRFENLASSVLSNPCRCITGCGTRHHRHRSLQEGERYPWPRCRRRGSEDHRQESAVERYGRRISSAGSAERNSRCSSATWIGQGAMHHRRHVCGPRSRKAPCWRDRKPSKLRDISIGLSGMPMRHRVSSNATGLRTRRSIRQSPAAATGWSCAPPPLRQQNMPKAA
jgi:hypothetical protein